MGNPQPSPTGRRALVRVSYGCSSQTKWWWVAPETRRCLRYSRPPGEIPGAREDPAGNSAGESSVRVTIGLFFL